MIFLRKTEFEIPRKTKKIRLNFGLILLAALLCGVIFGYLLKRIWNAGLVDAAVAVNYSLEWIDILQSAFLSALELLIVPLVLVSIIRSLLKAGSGSEASKSAVTILAVLLGTCALAALTGYGMVRVFGIGAADFTFARPTALIPTSVIRTIKSIVPSNLFGAISRNSVLPVVFLAALIGAAALAVKKSIPEYGAKLETAVEIAYERVGTVVDFVIAFTPFGILSLVTVNIATNDWTLLVSLGKFIGAFYAGSAIVAAIHIIILLIFRVKATEYVKKSGNAFLFALSSLSSIATMPLTIKAEKDLGVSDGTANLAASLGTCIGQNACAGLYPAMLATIIALMTPGQQDVWTVSFAVQLVLFTVVGSIGAAGVGGGNIQASLMVVSMMGMDFSLITLFLAVDFIVSLPRPPLNVSDSILAGLVTQKLEEKRNSKTVKRLKAEFS
ncbi:MAG: cation:dicarboxylase symporter family transporter [Spirochaetaceae bacterium]|nr:cation:dicarboxylase symporter family transporter [Spirochaetaceae bacterium]